MRIKGRVLLLIQMSLRKPRIRDDKASGGVCFFCLLFLHTKKRKAPAGVCPSFLCINDNSIRTDKIAVWVNSFLLIILTFFGQLVLNVQMRKHWKQIAN